jgi:hypothetical protein
MDTSIKEQFQPIGPKRAADGVMRGALGRLVVTNAALV